MNSSASQTRGSGRCDGTGRQSRIVEATVRFSYEHLIMSSKSDFDPPTREALALPETLTAPGLLRCPPHDSQGILFDSAQAMAISFRPARSSTQKQHRL